MTWLPTLCLAAAAWAGVKGQEPGLIEERTIKLSVCPVMLEFERDGRIKTVHFAFVPFGLRTACNGRFVRECKDIARDKGIPGFARHAKEPERVVELTVGHDKPELLAKLADTKAVRALREQVDVTWAPSGTGKEYTLDKKRTVSARLKWRTFVNAEILDLLDVLK